MEKLLKKKSRQKKIRDNLPTDHHLGHIEETEGVTSKTK